MAPVIVASMGLWMLIAPHRHRTAGERRHAARLAELDTGATESFFEERRSLQAYRPPRTDRGWRIIGAAMLLIGTVRVALAAVNAA